MSEDLKKKLREQKTKLEETYGNMLNEKTQEVIDLEHKLEKEQKQFENESRYKHLRILELEMEVKKLEAVAKGNEDKCSSTVAELNSVRKKHSELSAKSEKGRKKSLEKSNKKMYEMKAELKPIENKRECEKKKLKELELELNNKEKENKSLKGQINQTNESSSNKEDLHTGTNEEDENNTRQLETGSINLKQMQYCLYFNNFGQCTFDKENGRKCKFLHKRAPMSKFGSRCNKEKCKYSHFKNNEAPLL